jgi:hypothetical protein
MSNENTNDNHESAIRTVEYNSAPVSDIHILETDNDGKPTVVGIGDPQGDGITAEPTPRFWHSLVSRFSTHGLNMKLFKLFTYEEVFGRLTTVLQGEGGNQVRYAYEDLGAGKPRLLAVSKPTKAFCEYEPLKAELTNHQLVSSSYKDGVIISEHTPQHMGDVTVGPDTFSPRYVMESPIDGYGNPSIWLSLLRLVCSNGMVGYARAFKSEITIGGRGAQQDNPMFTLSRALDSFSNEEGYAALQERFESAQGSWASIAETQRAFQIVKRMATNRKFKDPKGHDGNIKLLSDTREAVINSRGGTIINRIDDTNRDGTDAELSSPVNVQILRAWAQMTGDLCHVYGITDLDALGQRKRTMLPARCTVYDVMNFLTELATHYTTPAEGRQLQAEIGTLISSEFHMEGSKKEKTDFADFFMDEEDFDPNEN